jgi:hypothetical protein
VQHPELRADVDRRSRCQPDLRCTQDLWLGAGEGGQSPRDGRRIVPAEIVGACQISADAACNIGRPERPTPSWGGRCSNSGENSGPGRISVGVPGELAQPLKLSGARRPPRGAPMRNRPFFSKGGGIIFKKNKYEYVLFAFA